MTDSELKELEEAVIDDLLEIAKEDFNSGEPKNVGALVTAILIIRRKVWLEKKEQ